jgi:hypothetical protein
MTNPRKAAPKKTGRPPRFHRLVMCNLPWVPVRHLLGYCPDRDCLLGARPVLVRDAGVRGALMRKAAFVRSPACRGRRGRGPAAGHSNFTDCRSEQPRDASLARQPMHQTAISKRGDFTAPVVTPRRFFISEWSSERTVRPIFTTRGAGGRP